MAIDPNVSPPSWLTSLLLSIVGGLFLIISSIGGWLFKSMNERLQSLEDGAKKAATNDQIAALEIRMASMASRKELIAHMEKLRDEAEERDRRNREDRQQMHKDNMDRFDNLREDVGGLRTDIREDIARVHERMDGISK